jgi:hypothetical protein
MPKHEQGILLCTHGLWALVLTTTAYSRRKCPTTSTCVLGSRCGTSYTYSAYSVLATVYSTCCCAQQQGCHAGSMDVSGMPSRTLTHPVPIPMGSVRLTITTPPQQPLETTFSHTWQQPPRLMSVVAATAAARQHVRHHAAASRLCSGALASLTGTHYQPVINSSLQHLLLSQLAWQ